MNEQKINQLLKDYGANIVARMVKILQINNKIATGRLISTIDYVVGIGEGEKTISILMEEYGKYVNDGRKPGKGIPVDALRDWMIQKGIDLKYSYVINRKIKEKGIDPVPFIDQALSQIEYEFRRDLTETYGDIYMKETMDIIKNSLRVV